MILILLQYEICGHVKHDKIVHHFDVQQDLVDGSRHLGGRYTKGNCIQFGIPFKLICSVLYSHCGFYWTFWSGVDGSRVGVLGMGVGVGVGWDEVNKLFKQSLDVDLASMNKKNNPLILRVTTRP